MTTPKPEPKKTSLNLGGVFSWSGDEDNGGLVNATREGAGFETDSTTIGDSDGNVIYSGPSEDEASQVSKEQK